MCNLAEGLVERVTEEVTEQVNREAMKKAVNMMCELNVPEDKMLQLIAKQYEVSIEQVKAVLQ